MSMLLTALICVTGAVDVWTESPLTRVFPDTPCGAEARREVRLYATRGERESFQICVRAAEDGIERVDIKADALDKQIGAPNIRRVGYLRIPNSFTGKELFPDPLLPFEPFSLDAKQTGTIWVSYEIPRDAKPGTHRGSLTVLTGKKKETINVTISISDFVMPELPTLRTAFALDRQAAQKAYGLKDNTLDTWKPMYDGLANSDLSYSVWDGGDLIKIAADGTANTDAFKEHLEYAAANMNTIDIGAGSNGIQSFPKVKAGDVQDPLQLYQIDLGNWLKEKGWLTRAYIQPTDIPERSQWQAARDTSFRVKRNDARISRLLVGPVHPFFERYEEIWATPLHSFDPVAAGRLRGGVSLAEKQAHPAKPTASSHAKQALDGYDGSLFSYWVSEGTPSADAPEWFEVSLPQALKASSIKAIWRIGLEPGDITLCKSRNGLPFEIIKATWTPRPPVGPFAQTWAIAEFEKPQTFDVLRLEFTGSHNGGPVGVTELLIGSDELKEPFQTVNAVETWLTIQPGQFPSFAADAHPVEARMVPWICYGHDMRGFMGGSLNTWPNVWAAHVAAPPLVWEGGGRGEDFLLYPGPEGPIPSIRAEALRDGIEDYERLHAQPNVTPRFYNPYPSLEELNAYADMIEKNRPALGGQTGEPKPGKKNFQGRTKPKK